MAAKKFSRRRFLKTTAAASATAVFAPYIRTSHAAGKLEVGFWDHWVPGGNAALTALCNEWAAKEKVEIKIDYIPSQGNKNLLTIAPIFGKLADGVSSLSDHSGPSLGLQ